MKYRFQFRRYRLPFRAPVRTAHGMWLEREGVIVRLENESGAVQFGEAAPIPDFGTETADAAADACRTFGEVFDSAQLTALPAHLSCLRHALASALDSPSSVPRPPSSNTTRAVAALLPAGKPALERIEPLADSGFRTFKWKVGVGDLADELALLDDVCAALPSGARLRLDANGAWDRRHAERWLERCADRPIEFIEQPAFAEPTAGRTAQEKINDLLLGLAHDFPTPLALDESLVGDADLERWIGAGWPGLYVIKPALFVDLGGALEKLRRARADVVFSSALETALGAHAALRTAFAWIEPDRQPPVTNPQSPIPRPALPPRALGFGVYPLFADARFDGPALAPFIRWQDVERFDPAKIWDALATT